MWVYNHSNELAHHGILGMKWGVRRTPKQLGNMSPRKKEKVAAKDAKKYVKAKMGYGDGAGTRRKLLKAELSNKMEDPTYKKAFDSYVDNADYAKAGKKAKSERRFKDFTSNKYVKIAASVAGVSAALGVGYKVLSTNPTAQRKAKAFVDEIKSVGVLNLFSGEYTKAGRAYVAANAFKKAIFA